MKIHEATEQSVELTDRETETNERYDFYCSVFKMPSQEAAAEALAQHKGGKPSKEFVEWLSKGALTKTDGQITPAA